MNPLEIGKLAIIHELQAIGVSEENAKSFADKVVARADKYYLSSLQNKGVETIKQVLIEDKYQEHQREFPN